MATTKQRKLAQAIVANSQKQKPLNKKELLVSAGYSEITAKATPQREIEAVGVIKELSAMGFTEENAKAVTAQIMLDDKEASRDRLKAAEMTFKVHGSFAAGGDAPTTNIQNIFYDSNIQIATKAYEQDLKKLLAHETAETIHTETEAS